MQADRPFRPSHVLSAHCRSLLNSLRRPATGSAAVRLLAMDGMEELSFDLHPEELSESDDEVEDPGDD